MAFMVDFLANNHTYLYQSQELFENKDRTFYGITGFRHSHT